jgi:hypothetical protein
MPAWICETCGIQYGAWWGRVVPEDGKGAVSRSAERCVAALGT